MNKRYPAIIIENCPEDKVSDYFDECIVFAKANNIPLLTWYNEKEVNVVFEIDYDPDRFVACFQQEQGVWNLHNKFPDAYVAYMSQADWEKISNEIMNKSHN